MSKEVLKFNLADLLSGGFAPEYQGEDLWL
jgi:hypothetical protein